MGASVGGVTARSRRWARKRMVVGVFERGARATSSTTGEDAARASNRASLSAMMITTF